MRILFILLKLFTKLTSAAGASISVNLFKHSQEHNKQHFYKQKVANACLGVEGGGGSRGFSEEPKSKRTKNGPKAFETLVLPRVLADWWIS